jgi:hypothetical protein
MRKNQRRKMIEVGETNEFSQMSHHLVVEHSFLETSTDLYKRNVGKSNVVNKGIQVLFQDLIHFLLHICL